MAIFVVYEALARTVLDPFSWVPATTTLVRAGELVADPVFFLDTIWKTVSIILLSTILAIVSGLVMGTVLWRFPRAYATANPYLTLYYSIPAFAFYPVLLSLVGAGPLSLILLASLLGFAAMTANVVIGLRKTAPIHVRLGRSLRLGQFRMLRRIYFPSAVPQILVGVRLAIAYAIIGVVGGEFLTGTSGLGYYIQFSYNSYQLVETYAGITIVVVTALVLNGLMYALSKATFAMETVGS
ncbi:ABC transporter permease [Nocardioides massiliensis]|uniref:NitT/TauT family transport system permease protein n=1 Tax=Nocardioides massiliensis TaxID=1325935 RepID=A0ABT9NTD0_9ACTN|nr:ABC transporter permease subunit [Nocardioides massiliensis]MDP9821152.1 NitT/TauT family transport system permease protein [Nocardioides massiliensis]MDP9823676.1 NitT/TauT family transport system permease protein [Nocardioides massiliensis]